MSGNDFEAYTPERKRELVRKLSSLYDFLCSVSKAELKFFLEEQYKWCSSYAIFSAMNFMNTRENSFFKTLLLMEDWLDKPVAPIPYFTLLQKFATRFRGKYLNKLRRLLPKLTFSRTEIKKVEEHKGDCEVRIKFYDIASLD